MTKCLAKLLKEVGAYFAHGFRIQSIIVGKARRCKVTLHKLSENRNRNECWCASQLSQLYLIRNPSLLDVNAHIQVGLSYPAKHFLKHSPIHICRHVSIVTFNLDKRAVKIKHHRPCSSNILEYMIKVQIT